MRQITPLTPVFQEDTKREMIGAPTTVQVAQATASDMGASLGVELGWYAGVVAPNGLIYCIPHSADNVLVIDPATDTAANIPMSIPSGTGKWSGGALGSDGIIYGMLYSPSVGTGILQIDPDTDTSSVSTMGASFTGIEKWRKAAAVAGGDFIYGVPRDASEILEIDVVAGVANQVTFGAAIPNTANKWLNWIVTPGEQLIAPPYDCQAGGCLIVDPAAKTARVDPMGFLLPATGDGWGHGAYGIDGEIYCPPRGDVPGYLLIDNTQGLMYLDAFTNQSWSYWGAASFGRYLVYVPYTNNSPFAVLDTVTRTVTYTSLGLTGTTGWSDIVLAPNGKYYGIPYYADTILVLEPV